MQSAQLVDKYECKNNDIWENPPKRRVFGFLGWWGV
jgi:hypothetical protein